MPTYSYECAKCDHVFEVFHSMKETPKVKCPECSSTRTQKMIGLGAGIIFKGSGFYETDFKTKKGTPPKEKSEKKDAAKSDAGCGSGGCGCASGESKSKGNGKSDTTKKAANN